MEADSDPNVCPAERHKREQRLLEAEIMKLKKAVPKGDKKRKKEIDAIVKEMERALVERQSKELAAFHITDTDKTDEAIVHVIAAPQHNCPKVSRAARRRDKKERDREALAEELKDLPVSAREQLREAETAALQRLLGELRLELVDIPSDGNCLYNALSYQMGGSRTAAELRDLAAIEMERRPDDFLPFLLDDNGDLLSPDSFTAYCLAVRDPAVWGGHVEIQALTDVLRCQVKVLLGTASPLTFGQSGDCLTVCYHKYLYTLGAHYNSTRPIS